MQKMDLLKLIIDFGLLKITDIFPKKVSMAFYNKY